MQVKVKVQMEVQAKWAAKEQSWAVAQEWHEE